MELLFSFAVAYLVMRATGKIDGLTGPNGIFPAIDLGPVDSKGQPRPDDSRWGSTAPRPERGGWKGWIDRGANTRTRWTDRIRQGAEKLFDKIDMDRYAGWDHENDKPGTDTRTRRQRWRDIKATCQNCGHGGQIPPQDWCRCGLEACACNLVEYRQATPPVPTPVGGDGATTPTEPPLDLGRHGDPPPAPPTAGNPATPVPVPVTGHPPNHFPDDDESSSPTEGDDVSSPVPNPGDAMTGAGITRDRLPALDPSDVRFVDARQYLIVHANEADNIEAGLRTRDVDPQTLAMIAEKRDEDRALVQRIHRVYGPVERAMTEAQHVAETVTYRHR